MLTRRDLLPIWIKVFVWIFFFLSFVTIICLIVRLFGIAYPIKLFGISSSDPLSQKGVIISVLFLLKGVVAYALWKGERDAIDIAIIDGMISIFICIGQTILSFLSNENLIRLELLIILPYLIKLYSVRKEWRCLLE